MVEGVGPVRPDGFEISEAEAHEIGRIFHDLADGLEDSDEGEASETAKLWCVFLRARAVQLLRCKDTSWL